MYAFTKFFENFIFIMALKRGSPIFGRGRSCKSDFKGKFWPSSSSRCPICPTRLRLMHIPTWIQPNPPELANEINALKTVWGHIFSRPPLKKNAFGKNSISFERYSVMYRRLSITFFWGILNCTVRVSSKQDFCFTWNQFISMICWVT